MFLLTHCGVPSITVHPVTLNRFLTLPVLLVEIVLIAMAAATPAGVSAVIAALLLSSGAALLIQAAAARLEADGPGPADFVTGVRLGVAIGIATMVVFADPAGFLLSSLLLLTVTTDALDGWIARKTRTSSRFGARFDLETDTALLAAVALAAVEVAGPAVLLAPLLRPGWIVAGWLLPWLERPLPASLRRKTICALSIILLVLIPWPLGGTVLAGPVATLAVTMLLISFVLDGVHQWQRHRRIDLVR